MLRSTGSGSAIVFRKLLTILSLIGLLLSVELWGVSYFFYSFKVGIDDFLMIRRLGKRTTVRCCLTLCIAWTLVSTGCTTTMRSLYESVRVGERFSLDDLSLDERRLNWAQRPDDLGRIWETAPEKHRAWLSGGQERCAVLTDDTGIAIAKYYHLSAGGTIIWLLWNAHRDDTLCETDLPRYAKLDGGDFNDPRHLLTETHRLFVRTRTKSEAAEVLSRLLKNGSDAGVDSIYRKVEYESGVRNECIMDWRTPDRARLAIRTHKDSSLLLRLDLLIFALFADHQERSAARRS